MRDVPQAEVKRGIWRSLLAEKEKRDSLALTRTLTSHEAALNMTSPKGLMLHGEVGTGKSMLIDLFADCLPTRKKRRWHFNTFMLETIAKLEQLRRDRLYRIPQSVSGAGVDDHSLLWLAKDMIQTSPILFLDEFQLPDRAASKIMTNLMTSFFQLGGVLIATSNRMPEELHKAAGTAFAPPPSRMESLRWSLGASPWSRRGRTEDVFAGQGEFAGFLEVLKARCEIWEMGGGKDYRRQEVDFQAPLEEGMEEASGKNDYFGVSTGSLSDEEVDDAASTTSRADSALEQPAVKAPKHYFILPESSSDTPAHEAALTAATARAVSLPSNATYVPWNPATMTVYGRTIHIPAACNGVTKFTFSQLCGTNLGPADYMTLASTYHTLILTNIPTLTWLQKNEARRFITLLDALYEARCKLLITAAAGPDELFFPEQSTASKEREDEGGVYAETFSEAYQDVTAPFRPNISSETPDYSEPDYVPSPSPERDDTHARFQHMLAPDSLEDDPPNRIRRDAAGGREREAVEPHRSGPDFGRTGAFTGEDERFAYKRARSRLWEMCGAKWWARNEEGWHKPLTVEVRRWERRATEAASAVPPAEVSEERSDVGMGKSKGLDEHMDEVMFRHGASPFRTAQDPPPKFSWTHVWGTMKWGRKAGAWGQGVEGLKDRGKEKR